MEVRCDLILLSWNNLGILRRCVDSVLGRTRERSRLIIVDNASSEQGLREYLSSLKGNGTVDVDVIFNRVNEGFARGMNRGLAASNAPFVCVMNNDLVVTDGWLTEMIKVAQSDTSIGLVNPSSNNFGLRPPKGISLERFAEGLAGESGRWTEMNACVGFCMLIKKEVIDKIGRFDDEFGYAYFEDTDYSRRAQAAGYKCVLAKGCYVFHEEGKSGRFLKSKKGTFDRSAGIFEKRWGRVLRVAYVLTSKDTADPARIRESVCGELRGHNRIWVFTEKGAGLPALPSHLDLMVQERPRNFFKLRSFWNIIKKKKRFDRVYVRDGALRAVLAAYGFSRGSEIKGI